MRMGALSNASTRLGGVLAAEESSVVCPRTAEDSLLKQYKIREFFTATKDVEYTRENAFFVRTLKVKMFCRIFVHTYMKCCKNGL